MKTLDLTLRIWRQAGPASTGAMVQYAVPGVSEDMSFLEMLDLLNERLITKGEEPVAFEHDCREGICGSCGLMINGQAHGPQLVTRGIRCVLANSSTRGRLEFMNRDDATTRASARSRMAAWNAPSKSPGRRTSSDWMWIPSRRAVASVFRYSPSG